MPSTPMPQTRGSTSICQPSGRFSVPHALRKTSQPKSFDTAEKATAKKRAAKKTAAKAPKPGKRRT